VERISFAHSLVPKVCVGVPGVAHIVVELREPMWRFLSIKLEPPAD